MVAVIEPEQLGAAVARASVGRAAPGGRRAIGRCRSRRVRRAHLHDVLLLPLLRLHALRGGLRRAPRCRRLLRCRGSWERSCHGLMEKTAKEGRNNMTSGSIRQ